MLRLLFVFIGLDLHSDVIFDVLLIVFCYLHDLLAQKLESLVDLSLLALADEGFTALLGFRILFKQLEKILKRVTL